VWVSEPNQPEVAPAGFLVGGDALLLARCGNNLGGAYHPGISPALMGFWRTLYSKAMSLGTGLPESLIGAIRARRFVFQLGWSSSR